MIFNMNGGGAGGGAAFNFEVVGGTTKPTSPSENTIWVNTSTTITEWAFDTENPYTKNGNSINEGVVWIKAKTYGIAEFNALKKNGIQVYPIFAAQYIGGSWVKVNAEIYQNGEWIPFWDGSLYRAGNEYTNVTGGWKSMRTGTYYSIGTFEKREDTLFVRDTRRQQTLVTPTNRIDLTNFNTLKFRLVTKGMGSWNRDIFCIIGVWNDVSTKADTNNALAWKGIAAHEGTFSVDVSKLSGDYVVGLIHGDDSNIGDKVISEVYLT